MNGWRLLHYYYLGRAVLGGPRALLGYLIRREGRKGLWRATRRLR